MVGQEGFFISGKESGMFVCSLDDPKGEGKLMMGEKEDLIACVSSVRR